MASGAAKKHKGNTNEILLFQKGMVFHSFSQVSDPGFVLPWSNKEIPQPPELPSLVKRFHLDIQKAH